MATINLTVQDSIALSSGDILQLPAAEDAQVNIVFINVLGTAQLAPANGSTVDNSTSNYNLTTGNYIISTTGSQNATWSVFTESGGGGATNVITSPDSESRELVAGTNITFDTGTAGELEINASGGGGGAGNWNFGSTETTQSGDYTILSTDRWIVYDGPGGNTWTLPASPTLGEAHVILNYGSGDLTLADPNGYSIGIQGDSVPISTSFGAPAPFVLVFSGASNGSGSYQWLVTPADSMSFLPTLELIIAGEPNSAEVYSISGTTPAGGRNIQIRDPGVSATQLGLVANASIDDGNIPKWVAGPSTGGYLADAGFSYIGDGTATLVAGTVTVSVGAGLDSSCVIIPVVTTPGGTQGFLSIQNIVADTSFDIVSSSGSDTSTIHFIIFKPAAA